MFMEPNNKIKNILHSEKGIALVITLVLAAVALAISTTTIYMVTQRITISGVEKRYFTALAAARGGSEIARKYFNLINYGYSYQHPNCTVDNLTCLEEKLQNQTSDWTTTCRDQGIITCTLGNYRVIIELTDTIEGNTGAASRARGVVTTNNLIPNPSVYPYIYKVSILSESTKNLRENANIIMLYAF